MEPRLSENFGSNEPWYLGLLWGQGGGGLNILGRMNRLDIRAVGWIVHVQGGRGALL